ncbi:MULTISPECIES: hypothetical protein [Rhizobium/Agrobacterium group]|jgi:hypothetical protein|uniref:Uncharacterized protein n=1 Tax=Agrobacterium larrymoorei TaxID=160699 RepID=A0ABX8T8M7_9HYPH|nr:MULTISPECIES: hypothetical protein [Rhizobium/Agrobacterium group]MCJ7994932.1 hypothetical protein [Rhizobium cremeum]MCJ8000756.1 hypothetical protein [Rhizobium cremeum]QYA08391.1 hypothetical protein J5285_06770 [Agrobacterium larrymoorei]
MRPSKNVLHHVLVRRAILTELRSGNGEGVHSRFQVFQDGGIDADKNAMVGMRTSKW